jgi:hypothetical protein
LIEVGKRLPAHSGVKEKEMFKETFIVVRPSFALTTLIVVLVLGCAVALPVTASADVPVYNDLWDISQGTTVTGNSPVLNNAANLIGGAIGIEAGNVLFWDSYPAGTVHWVEWQTTAPVTVRRFNLVANHEAITRRSMNNFALYAWSGGAWLTLYDQAVALPYGGGPNYANPTILELNALVDNVVSADQFRAEFTQASTEPAAKGPRIIELDGSPIPEPTTLGLLTISGLAALRRRRRR